MSDTIGIAFCNGIEDRHVNGLLRDEQLYRAPVANKIAWRLGWEVANMLTRRPLRNAKKSATTKGQAAKKRTSAAAPIVALLKIRDEVDGESSRKETP